MTERVKPRLARGLRDLLPEQMIARQRMIETIGKVYELYGFVPVHTPAVEYLDVLLGTAGDEATQSIFSVANPDSNTVEERLGLRFDLTVPLARVIAQHRQLPRPFRRYQVASVWRADKPGPGRFREFTQFDLDSVGTKSDVADTEIIAGMCDTLSALEVGPYKVKFSSRAVLNLLLEFAEIEPERGPDVFRVLDKLPKIGAAKVRKELTTGYVDESGDPIKGLDLTEPQVDRIERFLAVRNDDRREVVAELRELLAGVSSAPEQIEVVERISSHLYALGYGHDRVALDLSIARGLAYYSGPVFEAELLDAPQFGSVFGGGRYDFLVERFSGQKVPATGASIGVDRLLAALDSLGRLDRRKSTASVLVTVLDSALMEDYLAVTFELRRAGIPTEVNLSGQKVGKQLRYADACDIPLCLLIGADEKAEGKVTIKDMRMGKEQAEAIEGREEWLGERSGQRQVQRPELVDAVRQMLSVIKLRGESG